MKRAFEVTDPKRLARIHKICWKINEEANVGPVNTNIPITTQSIRMVIICESPSYCEVDTGFPTVHVTGKRIFNNLVRSGMIKIENGLPDRYCYSTHYKLFESNGIYITNLVRFQADFEIKGDAGLKNKRVKKAWEINKKYLFEELKNIKKIFGNAPILIACGSSFEKEICEVIEKIIAENMPWFITSHPSRSKNKYSTNYNFNNWSNENIMMTSFANKIIKKINEKIKN